MMNEGTCVDIRTTVFSPPESDAFFVEISIAGEDFFVLGPSGSQEPTIRFFRRRDSEDWEIGLAVFERAVSMAQQRLSELRD